jgi:hypothetical protein
VVGGPPNEDRDGLFGPTMVSWYPTSQNFDGSGFVDLLRTLSPYRRLDQAVREPLLEAITHRIRANLGDHHHIATPGEVAETVVWLCAEANHLVNGNVIRLR